MNLIELFQQLQSSSKDTLATSAVWLELRPELPESSLLSSQELLECVGNTKVFFTNEFQPFDTKGIFIGSTIYLCNLAQKTNTFEEFAQFLEK